MTNKDDDDDKCSGNVTTSLTNSPAFAGCAFQNVSIVQGGSAGVQSSARHRTDTHKRPLVRVAGDRLVVLTIKLSAVSDRAFSAAVQRI